MTSKGWYAIKQRNLADYWYCALRFSQPGFDPSFGNLTCLAIYIRYMICKHELKNLNSSKYCYVLLTIQIDISHLFTHVMEQFNF